MKVNKIISIAADILGVDGVKNYIETGVCEDLATMRAVTEKMLSAYNLTIQGIASEYVPLYKTETFQNVNEIIFKDLPDIPIEIIAVTDVDGVEIDCVQTLDRLCFKRAEQKVCVCYRYIPKDREFDEECDYAPVTKITPRIIAYGLASEFCAINGANSQSKEWGDKFERAIRGVLYPRKKLIMPRRRWL